MPVQDLNALYINEIKDLYSADKQAKTLHKRLQRSAKDQVLKDAIGACVDGIDDGMTLLKEICERHGKKATGKHCKGMSGLVEEAKNHIFKTEYSERSVKDAAIIAQSQRMTHYAISGYGTAAAYATRLGFKSDVKKLRKCLDNTYEGDRRLSHLAESGINEQAKS
ncbi:MAG: DUF892 family protein [Acidimicrobiales bacterium]|nr:ferritin-like domain-containing protein [Hyphomonadaceae bacterium]RZV44499.1 MAG: DUF892 family protein [Acidimicrobiales bacterium]